ncbi:restriction endonuclease subunit S [Membranihabitans maritimus]|uniref:restriction endonuclease subunit S n=1 Tax=Membranihabitans maritimus TaxID=2904244 RepID=UPI001F1D8DBE|nr:restriction endonuclease subunit S [Membranihabitans maritimus]
MSKWERASLKSFLNIEMGQSPKSVYVNNHCDGVPLLNGPAEFTDKYPIPVQYSTRGTRKANKNDILFCVRGSTTGRMNIADQTYFIGRGLASISHKNGCHLNSFVKGLLEIYLNGLLGGKGGSVFPNINKSQLLDFEINLPPLSNQIAIAKVLSDLDAKIEVNNKINEKLEAMAKLVYDYWFVQFDFPYDFARGKPDINGKPYKSSGGKMVYNEELKREIPEGWEVKPLNYLISEFKNGDWGKDKIQGNYTFSVKCIRGTDIPDTYTTHSDNSPARFILEKNKNKCLSEGDFVIEISGGSPTQSTGRICLITKELLDRIGQDVICSNFCKATSISDNSATYYFLNTWQLLYDNGVLFSWEGKTSGIKNLLFKSFVKNYLIPIPPLEIREKYQKIIETNYRTTQINLAENQHLASLRDWLLPMLMNGQVSVDEAEYMVYETVSMAAEEVEE